ncbi:MAG TPA: SOS response-associated peptidase [Noviherbaspirillum sp.]|uniref:SOS response-associated peptidase n=1 Tax=Noviherbaspirillum sp. TaxID=1926288 RepID=UPI002DDD3666|nr:SOS response-associated peptidase [Noviherbaspirillum sp.]HEV2612833.1 SOS response-associated peptidase [Noviherbaspirillum sp.]
MCGRFSLHHQPDALQDWYKAPMPEYVQHFNIAPTASIVVVRSDAGSRAGTRMRWGFIPSWAKDPAALPMLHNARGETVAEKPMFRRALRKRRCLIPASGFYEWKAVLGQKSKQPFYVSLKDDSPMSFAGLWECGRTVEGELLETCTIITTSANDMLAPIHHRMPALIDPADWDLWLDTEIEDVALPASLLRPFDAERMQVWGVSHAVNRVANDEPKLLLPIAEFVEPEYVPGKPAPAAPVKTSLGL